MRTEEGKPRPRAGKKEWALSIPSERDRVHQVLEITEDWLRKARFPAKEIHDITTAVIEAVMNAIVYGNEENPRKKVKLSYSLSQSELVITVADHGKGFQPRPTPLPDRPSLATHGRGILIMRALVDEVRFEKLSRGQCVRLIKYRGKKTRSGRQGRAP